MGFIREMLAKLKPLATTIWGDVCDTYKRTKILLLAIAGAVIYFEWEQIKAAWLVKSGANEIKSDQRQDQALAQQAKNASDQGDQLQQQANELPNQQQPVTDSWYEKDKK